MNRHIVKALLDEISAYVKGAGEWADEGDKKAIDANMSAVVQRVSLIRKELKR